MQVADILRAKRDEVLTIAHQHGARHVRIFGSVARGDAGPLSDIDFLVNQTEASWILAGLLQICSNFWGVVSMS